MSDQTTDRHATERAYQRLRDLRGKLLRLHKALLEDERVAYERLHGRVSGGELLQLVIQHEWFEWLRHVSELLVQIDETLDAEGGDDVDMSVAARQLFEQARRLLTPDEAGDAFQKRYFAALQREPAVVLAHAEVSRLLAPDV